MRLTVDNIKVGDGCFQCGWSDCLSYTIIEVKGYTALIQRDKATLITKPEFVVGGFSAHCINQESLKYDIQPDPEGYIITIKASPSGKHKGEFIGFGTGHYEKYDYNF